MQKINKGKSFFGVTTKIVKTCLYSEADKPLPQISCAYNMHKKRQVEQSPYQDIQKEKIMNFLKSVNFKLTEKENVQNSVSDEFQTIRKSPSHREGCRPWFYC